MLNMNYWQPLYSQIRRIITNIENVSQQIVSQIFELKPYGLKKLATRRILKLVVVKILTIL